MGKHRQIKINKDKHDIDEEVVKGVLREIVDQAKKRRILVLKQDGEVATELPLHVGVVLLILLSIFMFPVVVIAGIACYVNKVQFHIISDITDEEASRLNELDDLEHQPTLIGTQYDMVDGQNTLIQ